MKPYGEGATWRRCATPDCRNSVPGPDLARQGATHFRRMSLAGPGRKPPWPQGGVRWLGSTCRRSVGANPPLVTRTGHGGSFRPFRFTCAGIVGLSGSLPRAAPAAPSDLHLSKSECRAIACKQLLPSSQEHQERNKEPIRRRP
jgi:hypothetical protein